MTRTMEQVVVEINERCVRPQDVDRLFSRYIPGKLGKLVVAYSNPSRGGYLSLVYYPGKTNEEAILQVLRAGGVPFEVIGRHAAVSLLGWYKFPSYGLGGRTFTIKI